VQRDKFLADKVNLKYEDLQEEFCHFVRSYKTIIKSPKALFENVSDYKDDLTPFCMIFYFLLEKNLLH
jgi:capsular polysaccharide biosynthesis protein